MQVGKPMAMRGDVVAPGWAISMTQHHHEPPADEQQSESDESENSREGGSLDGAHGERSGNENQLDETLQSVLLYHLDDPVVHGQVHWTHIEDVITEVSSIIGVSRARVFNVHELKWTPPDIPEHFAPLIVQLDDDLPVGQHCSLCLVDVEVHANAAEFNYATIPAVDRRVRVIPSRVYRNQLLEITMTAPYCRQVQHRCLVMHNNIIVKLQDGDIIHAQHGDHFRVVVPPDLFCDEATSFRMNEAIEQEERHSPDRLRTPEEGYSPSLVPTEDIREEFGHNSEG